MSTLTGNTTEPLAGARGRRLPLPLPLWAVASRLLVLAGAVVGASTHRVASWQLADPLRLTLKLGSVGNVLASAGVRWDSLHYLAIAQHGYNTPSNTVFFPLYPLLIRTFAWVTSSYVVAGMLVSVAAFVVALLLLHQLAREELGDRVADATVLLLVFSPVSLFFTAIYTESLFLALSLATFLLARRGRLGWASVAAAGATLTHIEGLLLIAPLAIFYWHDQRETLRTRQPSVPQARLAATRALPLFLPLFALAGFLSYLHSRGYGWLAPSTDERYYNHHFTGPVVGIVRGVSAGIGGLTHLLAGIVSGSPGSLISRQNAFENLIYLVVLAICAATLVVAWRRLPKAYSVYSGLCLLTCISSPVTGQPLTSLDRYVLVLFPLWMVAAKWLSERRLLRATLTFDAALLFVFSLQFARWAFIG
jgi:Mannosyltransferase (PIG-V)